MHGVLVAGTSVEGLLFAHGLFRRGVAVTVFDHAGGLRPSPKALYRIDRGALAAVAACVRGDLYDVCVDAIDGLSEFSLTDLGDYPIRDRADAATEPSTVIDHQTLRTILINALGDRVRLGCSAIGYSEHAEWVQLRFEDGTTSAHADIAVFAGCGDMRVNTRHRRMFDIRSAGLQAVHGHAPLDSELLDALPRSLLTGERVARDPDHSPAFAVAVRAYVPRALRSPVRAAALVGLRGYVKWVYVAAASVFPEGVAVAAQRRLIMETLAVSGDPSLRMLLERSTDLDGFAGPIVASAGHVAPQSSRVTVLGSAARLVPALAEHNDTGAIVDAADLAIGIHRHGRDAVSERNERTASESERVVDGQWDVVAGVLDG